MLVAIATTHPPHRAPSFVTKRWTTHRRPHHPPAAIGGSSLTTETLPPPSTIPTAGKRPEGEAAKRVSAAASGDTAAARMITAGTNVNLVMAPVATVTTVANRRLQRLVRATRLSIRCWMSHQLSLITTTKVAAAKRAAGARAATIFVAVNMDIVEVGLNIVGPDVRVVTDAAMAAEAEALLQAAGGTLLRLDATLLRLGTTLRLSTTALLRVLVLHRPVLVS
ncbi:unnamed protein product [Linum trigynum]|uniref:Uncharacterized protein n=1 Tax=Linum trigynum TaxID=586398 RepID=A0AAV2E982_9ROSI